MECPECGTPMVAFTVPPALRANTPDGRATAAVCPDCLALRAVDDAPDDPDFSRIADFFPTDEAAIPMALAVGLAVESVALHRERIAALFEAVADAGVDPWLVLERLAAAPTVDPGVDLKRIHRQLEQLLA